MRQYIIFERLELWLNRCKFMNKDNDVLLHHIVESITAIEEYVHDCLEEDFIRSKENKTRSSAGWKS